jgi:serine/threonine protein kinase
MPFEYMQKNTVSSKTDVWSIGCIIFFIFSGGKLPWTTVAEPRIAAMLE